LYNGCSKKINISRKRLTAEKELYDDAKTLAINVKPGWKKGTKITFENEGDEGYESTAADLVFVIQEQERTDPGFERDGNNLIYTYKLNLADALTDCSLQIPTLDQRIVSIACPEVVNPEYEKLIPGNNGVARR
jgi:DnaJ-class molecular chaperone